MTLEEVPSSVVAIYAHPDDPEVSCGGALTLWSDAGAEVVVVIATRGEKGADDAAVDTDVLADTRAAEAAAAAEVMGARTRLLGLPDGEVTNDAELRRTLVALLRELKPHTVVAPDPTATFFGDRYVNHRDHRELGWAVLDAVAPAVSSPLYFPDTGPAHRVSEVLLSGTLEPDTWVDIAAVVDRKVRALRCHRSQLGDDSGWVAEVVERRARDAGRAGGLELAEGFRRLRLA